ncbi:hypothetical protein FGO68_gene17262 [Halteria grandinella]|uniref:Uncharacterized protein n=1 Tax=Halteria grandinella TaxID=5974 RepID=A0A8J8T7A3_HALGN|nr:hypothetical protein FGO68_gene17262 [Halteria grandinella]
MVGDNGGADVSEQARESTMIKRLKEFDSLTKRDRRLIQSVQHAFEYEQAKPKLQAFEQFAESYTQGVGIKAGVIAGEKSVLLRDLEKACNVGPEDEQYEYRGRRYERMAAIALARLYVKGENKFTGGPLYSNIVNQYSLRKDKVMEGNATDIVQNAIFGDANPLIKDDLTMYSKLNTLLTAKFPNKLPCTDSAAGLPVAVSTSEGVATVQIGHFVKLTFGFINLLTDYPPHQSEEEDQLRKWGFKNYIIRLRNIKFEGIEEGFGGFNARDVPFKGAPQLKMSKKDALIRDINMKILENAFKKYPEGESILDHFGLVRNQDEFLIAAKCALSLYASLAYIKLSLDIKRHPMVQDVEYASPTQTRFRLKIAADDLPINFVLSKVQTDPNQIKKVPITLVLAGNGLPVLNSDLVSKKVMIPVSLEWQRVIEDVEERHQYKRVIDYYEAFADQVLLHYPGVSLDLHRPTRHFDLHLYHPSKLFLRFGIVKLPQSGYQFKITASTHLTHPQLEVFNEMLSGIGRQGDLSEAIRVFLGVLIPHCIFRYVQCGIEGVSGTYHIHHNIADYIALRHAYFFNPAQLDDKAFLSLVHQQARPHLPPLPPLLKSTFGFSEDQLLRARQELYQHEMVIITNNRPVMGELDYKFDAKLREVHYVRVQIAQGRLRHMGDLCVGMQVGQLLGGTAHHGGVPIDSSAENVEMIEEADGGEYVRNGCSGHGMIDLDRLISMLTQ